MSCGVLDNKTHYRHKDGMGHPTETESSFVK